MLLKVKSLHSWGNLMFHSHISKKPLSSAVSFLSINKLILFFHSAQWAMLNVWRGLKRHQQFSLWWSVSLQFVFVAVKLLTEITCSVKKIQKSLRMMILVKKRGWLQPLLTFFLYNQRRPITHSKLQTNQKITKERFQASHAFKLQLPLTLCWQDITFPFNFQSEITTIATFIDCTKHRLITDNNLLFKGTIFWESSWNIWAVIKLCMHFWMEDKCFAPTVFKTQK